MTNHIQFVIFDCFKLLTLFKMFFCPPIFFNKTFYCPFEGKLRKKIEILNLEAGGLENRQAYFKTELLVLWRYYKHHQ